MWRRFTLALLAALAGCGGFGRVNQGQVIAYDKFNGLVTIVSDSNYRDPERPRFDVLPPLTVGVPEDPKEMGPEPQAGKLLAIDADARRAVVFDSAAQSLRTIEIQPLSQADSVARNDPRVSGTRFPVIDRANATIRTYLPHDRRLLTFAVAREHLDLPEDTWRAGDEVRYYYKDPARALRMMNVSRTDLGKAGK